MQWALKQSMRLAAVFLLCGPSSSVVVLKTAETLASGTEDLEPIEATGSARSQFLGISSQPVRQAPDKASWSDKIHNRQDPYAPEHLGAATVDDWCNQPEIHDPACMANPVAMSIDEEIDAVMRHMMCRMEKGPCSVPPESTKRAPSSKESHAASPTMVPLPATTPQPAGQVGQAGQAGQAGQVGRGPMAGEATPDAAKGTPDAAKGQPASGQPAIHDKEAEEAATAITGLVDKMSDITNDLDRKGELDPELGRTTEEMIETGRDTVGLLKKMSNSSDHEANKGLDGLVHEAEELDHSFFKFQTGVHPHGYKWWRYRWEYAFVEANTLNSLVFIAMLLYFLLHWATESVCKLTPSYSPIGSSVATLYQKLCHRGMYETSILAFLAFVIWGLEECGLFIYLVEANPVKTGMETVHGQTQMHWPTTDQHLIYTLRTVNMHFFIGMALYLLLMYHVSHGAICILEQFMKHENPEFYARFIESGGVTAEWVGKTEEVRQKGEIMARLFNNKGFLGKVLTSDTTMRIVVGHFDVDADYVALKHCVAEELKKPLGSLHYSALPELPIYPYIAMKLQRALEDMIVIDWRVWIMVELVLVVQAFIHYYFHQAVIELLPFTIAMACVVFTCQFVWTRRMASYVVDEKNHFEKDHVAADNSFAQWMLWIQQLNFFFLCFSASRLLLSSFFWTDYFSLSCAMLGVFLCLYLLFVFMGSLIVPMFIIMLSVQRVTEEDVADMKMILQVHVDSEARAQESDKAKTKQEMSPAEIEKEKIRKKIRKSATSLVVV